MHISYVIEYELHAFGDTDHSVPQALGLAPAAPRAGLLRDRPRGGDQEMVPARPRDMVIEAPDPGEVDQSPQQDYWTQEGSTWTIHHVQPRPRCFVPQDGPSGPPIDHLLPQRQTTYYPRREDQDEQQGQVAPRVLID